MLKLNKKLVLYELNLYNFLYIIFLKFFFSEIFYITITGSIKNFKIVEILKKFRINWINFQDFNIGSSWSAKLKKNIYFSDCTSKILVSKIWNNYSKLIYQKKEYLEACLSFKIQKKCDQIFEIFEISKILFKKNNNNIYILANKNFFFKKIKEEHYFDYSYKTLPDIQFLFLKYFVKFSTFVIKALYNKFILLFSLNKKLPTKNIKLNSKTKNKVIYFPHKGVFYLDRLKDQFYSSSNNSFLNKNKIMHIEWQSNDIDKKSLIFYKDNNIPLIIWNSLPYRKLPIILKAKQIFKKLNFMRKLYNYDILFLFFCSVLQTLKAQHKLLNFKDIKLALISRDLLFPLELSLALKKSGIKTVCVQDRLLMAGLSHKMIFDHYFTLGPQAHQMLRNRMDKTILNFHKYYLSEINPVNFKKFSKKKLISKRSKKLNCLVIDFHSEENWYTNGTNINNWKDNNNFYENIIKLAKEHSNINFMIKSKSYTWIKIPYFFKTMQKIKNIKNIKILVDNKKNKPKNYLAYCDFALARHSSLSDQMLYINKPVLIDDLNGFPSKFFSFGNNIICKNRKDLEKKLTLLVKNIYVYNQKLNKTRKLLFYYNSIVNLKIFLEKELK
jgi:hypothetical protein